MTAVCEIAVRYVSMVDEALDLVLLPAAREQPRNSGCGSGPARPAVPAPAVRPRPA